MCFENSFSISVLNKSSSSWSFHVFTGIDDSFIHGSDLKMFKRQRHSARAPYLLLMLLPTYRLESQYQHKNYRSKRALDAAFCSRYQLPVDLSSSSLKLLDFHISNMLGALSSTPLDAQPFYNSSETFSPRIPLGPKHPDTARCLPKCYLTVSPVMCTLISHSHTSHPMFHSTEELSVSSYRIILHFSSSVNFILWFSPFASPVDKCPFVSFTSE